MKYVSLKYLESKCRSIENGFSIVLSSGNGGDSLDAETCLRASYDLADSMLAVLGEIGFFDDKRAANEFISRAMEMCKEGTE